MRSTIVTCVTREFLTAVVLLSSLALVAAQSPESPPAEAERVETESMQAAPQDASPEATTWAPPNVEQVKSQALDWLKASGADEAVGNKVAALWAEVPQDVESGELLSRLTESFALADVEAAKLVDLCSADRRELLLPEFKWLKDAKTPATLSANLRLLYGRWLVQQLMFDEAAAQLAGLKPGDVVDPASLLFYQAVVHHRLLDRKAGLAASQSLIEGAEHSPQRYVAVTRLIRDDLKGLKEETLDHIARRMEDIQRRLDLGRAGPRVRGIEDGVIESLDKLIKKIEESQQSSSSSSSSGSSDNIQSNNPAPDSQIIGGKGAGNVTKRGVGNSAGWGDLPPKQREEALQQIGREFPAHYRDVVEQYFRRLAAE